MAQAFDEPLVVVGLDEGGNGLAEVVDIVTEPSPQALLLQGADEALGHAVALGLSDEGGIVLDAQPVEGALEVMGSVLTPPVVPQLDASGDVRSAAPAAITATR